MITTLAAFALLFHRSLSVLYYRSYSQEGHLVLFAVGETRTFVRL